MVKTMMRAIGPMLGPLLGARGGKRSGTISGLPVSRPVEILSDRFGIPHIYAENENDLFTAQGYVHARDRLWQMESARRVAASRMAEVAGPALVALDHFSLLAGFAGMRDRAIRSATAANKAILGAYVKGVKA